MEWSGLWLRNSSQSPSSAEGGSGGPLYFWSGGSHSGEVGVLVLACDVLDVDVTGPADGVKHQEAPHQLGIALGDMASTRANI